MHKQNRLLDLLMWIIIVISHVHQLREHYITANNIAYVLQLESHHMTKG